MRYAPGPRGQERGTTEVQRPGCPGTLNPGDIRRAYEEARGILAAYQLLMPVVTRKRCTTNESARGSRRCWPHCPGQLSSFQPEELLRRIPRAALSLHRAGRRAVGCRGDSYLFDVSRIWALGATHAN